MDSIKIPLMCIIVMMLLNQLSIVGDFHKTGNQIQKLQDSTNLLINRTDTILTILQD